MNGFPQLADLERTAPAPASGAIEELRMNQQTQIDSQRSSDTQERQAASFMFGPTDTVRGCHCLRAVRFEAHGAVAAAHNVPSEQPSIEYAVGIIQQLLVQPISQGIVAERDGRIAGSIFLHDFGSVGVIGPLTVHPRMEGGIGRRLMDEALAAARGRGLERVRLVQSPAHLRSLALYTKSGFDVQEPLVLICGLLPRSAAGWARIRPADGCGRRRLQ